LCQPSRAKEKHNFASRAPMPKFAASEAPMGIFFAGDWLLAAHSS
jgi:hypothetical protein